MKVAIVGGAPSSQMLAPFEDESWDIWVLGNQLQSYDKKRITRIFEIHENLDDKDPNYPQWVSNFKIPMVVSDKFPVKGKHISLYPKKEVSKYIGGHFSSSPAYMIGMAIYEGYEEIGIYGVDMAVDDHEYFKQRPDMYAWIAYAKAKGIKITIPEASSLFKGTYDEGRDWNKKSTGVYTESAFMQFADGHEKKMETVQAAIRQLEIDYASHDGARQVYERLSKAARAMDAGVEIKTLLETVSIV